MSDFPITLLDKLRTFDTPTICNVIELFEVRPRSAGYVDSRIRACFPDLPPIVGFASTATFRSSAPPPRGDLYMALAEQVESFTRLSGPAIIVFQDLDVPAAGATFGEVMCASYRAFGALGLITSGAGRDLDQVRALAFPVFTGGEICSHGYCHMPQLDVSVQVGGLIVNPDDLLHADRNGITSIPREIAAEVADAAPEFVAAEEGLLTLVRGGEIGLPRFAEARKELGARVAALRKRVSRRTS